jgi:hypothetical protein
MKLKLFGVSLLLLAAGSFAPAALAQDAAPASPDETQLQQATSGDVLEYNDETTDQQWFCSFRNQRGNFFEGRGFDRQRAFFRARDNCRRVSRSCFFRTCRRA